MKALFDIYAGHSAGDTHVHIRVQRRQRPVFTRLARGEKQATGRYLAHAQSAQVLIRVFPGLGGLPEEEASKQQKGKR